MARSMHSQSKDVRSIRELAQSSHSLLTDLKGAICLEQGCKGVAIRKDERQVFKRKSIL